MGVRSPESSSEQPEPKNGEFMPFRIGPVEILLITFFPLVSGILCAFIASRRGRNYWQGFLIGAGSAFVGSLIIPIIGGFVGMGVGVVIVLKMSRIEKAR